MNIFCKSFLTIRVLSSFWFGHVITCHMMRFCSDRSRIKKWLVHQTSCPENSLVQGSTLRCACIPRACRFCLSAHKIVWLWAWLSKWFFLAEHMLIFPVVYTSPLQGLFIYGLGTWTFFSAHQFLYARLKNGTYYAVAMSVHPSVRPSVRVFRTFLQHALRYQFETWYIHSVGGTTCRVRVASQLGHFDLVYSQK